MEQVVLLDENGHSTGVTDKATVHHRDTPLHLAFSCYVFNARDDLLLTQRAHGKTTWPSVWTNTCCGHPAPGEALGDAVRRRLRDELGLTTTAITLALPRFRYRAVMSSGVVENEMCPVFWTRITEDERPAQPNPDEVASTRWVAWPDFCTAVRSGAEVVSPWCEQQVRQLAELGPHPDGWPVAAHAELPPAARRPDLSRDSSTESTDRR